MYENSRITILAEDIKNFNYYDSFNCPITRALKKAGIEANDTGCEIVHKSLGFIKTPDDLWKKVVGMQKTYFPKAFKGQIAIKPEDFTYSLEIPDHW